MKLLLYCPKGKPLFRSSGEYDEDWGFKNFFDEYVCAKDYYNYHRNYETVDEEDLLNGKIAGECDFEVSKIELHSAHNYGPAYFTKRQKPFKYFSYIDLLLASCMQDNEMLKYLGNKGCYAIHIKNLKVFDKPKELSEFYSIHNVGGMLLTDKLEKAPRNMQRVSIQEWEYGTYNANDICVLISIRPEKLCKIFNGEKTIILSKKVLKEMLKND